EITANELCFYFIGGGVCVGLHLGPRDGGMCVSGVCVCVCEWCVCVCVCVSAYERQRGRYGVRRGEAAGRAEERREGDERGRTTTLLKEKKIQLFFSGAFSDGNY